MIEKNKDAYENYVCPSCFNQLDKCICITFPPYYMTWIDVKIQEHVRILNKKGYFTKFSCEGHSKHNKTYIVFVYDYGFEKKIKLPEGFNMKNLSIEHSYDKHMSDDEFERQKENCLNTLLKWCNELPTNNNPHMMRQQRRIYVYKF